MFKTFFNSNFYKKYLLEVILIDRSQNDDAAFYNRQKSQENIINLIGF